MFFNWNSSEIKIVVEFNSNWSHYPNLELFSNLLTYRNLTWWTPDPDGSRFGLARDQMILMISEGQTRKNKNNWIVTVCCHNLWIIRIFLSASRLGWSLFVLILAYPIRLDDFSDFDKGLKSLLKRSVHCLSVQTSTVRVKVRSGHDQSRLAILRYRLQNSGKWPKEMKSSKQQQTLTEFIWHLSHCANKSQTNRKISHLS